MILAGNWKMNKSPEEGRQFILEMKNRITQNKRPRFIFLIPALNFGLLGPLFKEAGFSFGGQNCFIQDSGSFTGENSPQVMRQMGADFCLVGHSERRILFAEDQALIQKKIQAVLRSQMTPILCVGENLQQKEQGLLKTVLQSQLEGIPKDSSVIVAYEPVWAIGSGLSAKPSDVQSAVSAIREIQGADRILYGGSVGEGNAQSLFAVKGLSGFLIGKNSLQTSSLLSLYEKIQS